MPDFITVDLRQVKRFARELEKASDKAVLHAIRAYVDAAAFEAQREWKEQIAKTFTLRNTWTTRSIQVRRASGMSPKQMVARVGSIADYMDEQEEGTTTRKTGKHGVALPTGASAGQRGARKRTKPIRRSNYLSALKVHTRISGTREQRNRAAMERSIKLGTRVAILELADGRHGLFRIAGSRKRLRKPTMLYDLSRASTTTPASRTLEHTLRAIQPTLPRLAIRALMTQLNRSLANASKG